MCGIVYKRDFTGRPVAQAIAQLYKNQKHRGSEGFGFYDFNGDVILRATREESIMRKLKHTDSSAILYHHRFPTSTDNVLNAAHPFAVKVNKKKYVTVHNGVIYNAASLKAKHEKLGYKYTSVQADGRFNDSEALAHELALYLSGEIQTMDAAGSIAFITTQGKNTYFGRNSGSPLQYRYRTDSLTIASEISGADVTPNTLFTFDGSRITNKPMTIPSYTYFKPTTTITYHDDDGLEDIQGDIYWWHYKREFDTIDETMAAVQTSQDYDDACAYYRERCDMLLVERHRYYGDNLKDEQVYTAKMDAILDWFDYQTIQIAGKNGR